MLKPLLRLLSKRRPRVPPPQEDFSADCAAENAANEALEARMQTATSLPTMSLEVTPQWFHVAPDRDIPNEHFSSRAQTPEQQSPTSKSVQLQEQEWW